MRKPLTYILSLLLCVSAGCGNPSVELQDTPESCLVDSSQGQDCDMEPVHQGDSDSRILFESRSDLSLVCEQKCSRSTRFFDFITLGGVESLHGFDFLVELSGLGVNYTRQLKRVDAFNNVETMVGVSFVDNASLEVVEGFNSLESVENAVRFEDNPKLVDLRGLGSLRSIGEIGGPVQQGLVLLNNNSLVDMTGLERLEVVGGKFHIYGQHQLKSLQGLDSLQEVDRLVIKNFDERPEVVKLNSLAGLENLRRIHKTFSIENAPNLRRCEAEALIAQLEEPPEVVNLVNLSDEPCD